MHAISSPQLIFFDLYCIAVYEVFERMAYYGISSNLVLYLTKKLHQGTVTSANNVTNWVGTIWITPILGAYVADAHLGRYWTFLIASIIYLSVSRSNHSCTCDWSKVNIFVCTVHFYHDFKPKCVVINTNKELNSSTKREARSLIGLIACYTII